MSRVPAINGFLSLVCSGGRHAGCRPEEQAICECRCHRSVAAKTTQDADENPGGAGHGGLPSLFPGSSSESPFGHQAQAEGKPPYGQGPTSPPSGRVRRTDGSTF
jgi:hypothetical protein